MSGVIVGSAGYKASRIKRHRVTRTGLQTRRGSLFEIVAAQKPMTVRQVFYQAYAEVWLEKDALAGVVNPVTSAYDVPLMVSRGYASLSFLHSAAEQIAELEVPAFIYHLGDHDPSGVNAAEKIEQTLREMAPSAEIHFDRVAVTRRQIVTMNLPSRPTKITDSRATKFPGGSVELDAIPPDDLRNLVRGRIERHLPRTELDVLKIAEASERAILLNIVGGLRRQSGGRA
jgi:hypothetical protein